MRGLYIHIPFCKHICNYCDFHKRIAKNQNQISEYVNKLIEEIEVYKPYLNSDIKTIFIGGGTPNILNDLELERLFVAISDYKLNVLEYTIEINPELLTISQVELFKKYNINRVSIGAQNFIDNDLEFLGRHHRKENILNAIRMLRDNGIDNISMDLMFGYPTDSLIKIKENLDVFYDLNLPHVSYYSMILEEKTKFFIDYKKKKISLLDEDLLADMYDFIRKDLYEHGYKQYEISNYSKNKESIHNKIYWQNLEYIGVGAGASGYIEKIRYENNSILDKYFNEFISTKDEITEEISKSEFMILGLRMIDGVSKKEYFSRYQSNINEDFDLDYILNNGLIIETDDIIKLSEKGIPLANIVFERFV